MKALTPAPPALRCATSAASFPATTPYPCLLADRLCRLDAVSARLAGRWATTGARPGLELERLLSTQALDFAEVLGMTPRSRARLGLDVKRAQSFDLARHWREQGDA